MVLSPGTYVIYCSSTDVVVDDGGGNIEVHIPHKRTNQQVCLYDLLQTRPQAESRDSVARAAIYTWRVRYQECVLWVIPRARYGLEWE